MSSAQRVTRPDPPVQYLTRARRSLRLFTLGLMTNRGTAENTRARLSKFDFTSRYWRLLETLASMSACTPLQGIPRTLRLSQIPTWQALTHAHTYRRLRDLPHQPFLPSSDAQTNDHTAWSAEPGSTAGHTSAEPHCPCIRIHMTRILPLDFSSRTRTQASSRCYY